jgi:hypothetical protein
VQFAIIVLIVQISWQLAVRTSFSLYDIQIGDFAWKGFGNSVRDMERSKSNEGNAESTDAEDDNTEKTTVAPSTTKDLVRKMVIGLFGGLVGGWVLGARLPW